MRGLGVSEVNWKKYFMRQVHLGCEGQRKDGIVRTGEVRHLEKGVRMRKSNYLLEVPFRSLLVL